MRGTIGRTLSRGLLPAVALVLLAVVGGWLMRSDAEPPASDTEARIAFYQARIGGRGTYASRARLGLAYLQKARETGEGRWLDEAERHLRASLDSQTNYEALLGMGALLAARHQFDDALRHATEAAAALPASIEAQGLLFEIHLALGDVPQAEAVVQRMMSAAPGFAAFSRLAALDEYRGALDEALATIERACDDAERGNLPAGSRAWCEVRRGALLLGARCDAAGAEQAYQRALRIFPGYFFAREHLAELHAAQGKPGEAIALYETLLRDLPGPGYRLAIADVYQAVGRDAQAQRERAAAQTELQHSVESGSREHVREFILLTAEQDDGAAQALRLAEQEWSGRRDWYTADALAWAWHHNGRTRDAVAMVETALQSGVKASDLRLRAAEIFLRAGRGGEAHRLMDDVMACPAALMPGEAPAAARIRETLANRRNLP
ncbi:MAG: tetratricopeptide repeat protein [Candidatus Acidiferrales bacterium]